MGRVIPGVNDQRSSGIFSGDWSDTSSISSNGSNRFRRLTTDMARASIDSLRRGSKESLDDIFKRGMSSLARNGDSLDLKRTGSGDMTRSLSQKLSFTNPLAAKMKRTSSVRSAYSDICPSQKAIEDQIHKDWLLANQLDSAENGRHTDRIINPMRSVDGFSNTNSSNNPTLSRTNSLMNRFSKIVTNKTVSPYYHQEQNPTKQTEMSGKREEMTQFTNGRRDEVLSRARAYKGFV
jgi:hypothetical protein